MFSHCYGASQPPTMAIFFYFRWKLGYIREEALEGKYLYVRVGACVRTRRRAYLAASCPIRLCITSLVE